MRRPTTQTKSKPSFSLSLPLSPKPELVVLNLVPRAQVFLLLESSWYRNLTMLMSAAFLSDARTILLSRWSFAVFTIVCFSSYYKQASRSHGQIICRSDTWAARAAFCPLSGYCCFNSSFGIARSADKNPVVLLSLNTLARKAPCDGDLPWCLFLKRSLTVFKFVQ